MSKWFMDSRARKRSLALRDRSRLKATSGILILCAISGCNDAAVQVPDFTPLPTPKLTLPSAVGSQWTYRHTYGYGFMSTVIESRSGIHSWEIVSSRTGGDTTTAVVRVASVDSVYMHSMTGGSDTSYVINSVSQFTFVTSADSIASDWKAQNALRTCSSTGVTFPRAMIQPSDTVRIEECSWSSSWYVSRVGLLRYVYHRGGTSGYHYDEQFVLVDKAFK